MTTTEQQTETAEVWISRNEACVVGNMAHGTLGIKVAAGLIRRQPTGEKNNGHPIYRYHLGDVQAEALTKLYSKPIPANVTPEHLARAAVISAGAEAGPRKIIAHAGAGLRCLDLDPVDVAISLEEVIGRAVCVDHVIGAVLDYGGQRSELVQVCQRVAAMARELAAGKTVTA